MGNDSITVKDLIDENATRAIEDQYWNHIKYAETINTLIYSGRIIFPLITIVIVTILLVKRIKSKKYNKTLLIFSIIFTIITIILFFIPIMPV